MDIGCPILRAPYFEQMITWLGYFGHGAVGAPLGLGLLAHGYLYDNQRNRRAGMAILAALIVVGIATELLKNTLQWPRPKLRSSYGFPSGHTSAAFALATTLSATFPALGPLFFILAVLTGISRLYLRAHSTLDVTGGAVLGLAAGWAIANKFIDKTAGARHSVVYLFGWVTAIMFAAGGWGFFYSSEKNIAAFMLPADSKAASDAAATVDFGTPQARSHLRYGWSGDETWAGNRTVVWANGMASEIALNLPAAQEYRFRLNAYPYAPKGPACQRVEVKINDLTVTRIFLEQGWHSYEFVVPQSAVRAGTNSLQFFFDYAEAPKLRGRLQDERQLSVAFDMFQVFAAR